MVEVAKLQANLIRFETMITELEEKINKKRKQLNELTIYNTESLISYFNNKNSLEAEIRQLENQRNRLLGDAQQTRNMIQQAPKK